MTNDLSYDQRMIRICTSLAEAGYQVKLVGRIRSTSIALKPQSFEQKRLFCFFQRGKLFYLEYNVRLFLYLLFAPFDIVCAVDLDTILPGFYSSRWKRKSCVYDAHEYFTEVPEVIRRPRIKKIWERIAKHTIPKIPHCYTVGPELAKIFEQRYGPKFETLRSVPFSQAGVAKPSIPPIILYQGALNEGRGLEQAILAMKQLEGVEFWLAGEGDLSQQLRQMVKEEGLDSKIRFLGFVPPDELKAITLQASIGLNLLENKGLSYYYSLANKAFDYIQAGIPSLNMDFPEYRTLNEHYSTFVLLKTLSVEGIAKALHQLLENKELYAQLRTNCLQAKQVLIWEKESEKLLTFYANLLRTTSH